MEGHVRVSGWGNPKPGESTTNITLSGISKEEQEQIEGVTNGHYWMTVKNGKLVFLPTKEQLPDPVEDTEMLPFWGRNEDRQMVMQELIFDPEEQRCDSPSFMVKSLCGYHYTTENYQRNAELLRSYGFICMRSQRGSTGRFWETWFLPGAWAAKGKLKEALDKTLREGGTKQDYATQKNNETKRVISFLCAEVSFGQLDVVIQRAAMIIPD